jgi:hypothetical protein
MLAPALTTLAESNAIVAVRMRSPVALQCGEGSLRFDKVYAESKSALSNNFRREEGSCRSETGAHVDFRHSC